MIRLRFDDSKAKHFLKHSQSTNQHYLVFHSGNECSKCFTASSNLYYHRLTHKQVNIREIKSHSLSVINSRDNSQKIRIQPGWMKNCQLFLSAFIIILVVHVYFSSVLKIEIMKDLIFEVEPRMRAKLITCLYKLTFFKSGFWFL